MNRGLKNKELVRKFFQMLEEGSAEGVAGLFAKDGVHVNPYGSGLFPAGVEGREAIKAYWQGPIDNFDGMTFPIDEIYAMEDENIVYVKFTGNINLKGGGLYSNDYYSIFKFDHAHKIVEYVEIFNPIVAARGFGLIDQIK